MNGEPAALVHREAGQPNELNEPTWITTGTEDIRCRVRPGSTDGTDPEELTIGVTIYTDATVLRTDLVELRGETWTVSNEPKVWRRQAGPSGTVAELQRKVTV